MDTGYIEAMCKELRALEDQLDEALAEGGAGMGTVDMLETLIEEMEIQIEDELAI